MAKLCAEKNNLFLQSGLRESKLEAVGRNTGTSNNGARSPLRLADPNRATVRVSMGMLGVGPGGWGVARSRAPASYKRAGGWKSPFKKR